MITTISSYKMSVAIIVVLVGISSLAFYMIKKKGVVADKANQIYSVLDRYRVPYDIDKRSIDQTASTAPIAVQGVEHCIENLAYFVRKNRPINMLLVGFPFKSCNQEKKVLGKLPDMAERKSLEYLQQICNEIKQVYAPGAKILIFCDGIPFAEFFGIDLADVVAYEKALEQLRIDLPDITLYTSAHMLKDHRLATKSQMIELIDTYEPSDATFTAGLESIPETALKRFALDLDHQEGRLLVKKHTLEAIVIRTLAREMRLRTYITKVFPSPDFFRLTVHVSPDISKKFGIRLSPTSDITPYHGVVVEEDDSSWSIRFKKDVDTKQYSLHNKLINGVLCGYFKHDAR
jgi:L-tyrosine isonitrile synthase